MVEVRLQQAACCGLLVVSLLANLVRAQEEVVEYDFLKEANIDFDGNSTPDAVVLKVRKELDYAVNPYTEERSKEKYWWYHCWLEVTSGQEGKLFYKDEWSIKESDVYEYAKVGVMDFETPEEFFNRYFRSEDSDFQVSWFDIRKLSKSDVDPEALKFSLANSGLDPNNWKKVQSEILSYENARVFTYRGNWREDLRQVVFVKSLNRGVVFRYGYPP